MTGLICSLGEKHHCAVTLKPIAETLSAVHENCLLKGVHNECFPIRQDIHGQADKLEASLATLRHGNWAKSVSSRNHGRKMKRREDKKNAGGVDATEDK